MIDYRKELVDTLKEYENNMNKIKDIEGVKERLPDIEDIIHFIKVRRTTYEELECPDSALSMIMKKLTK